jgi:hypothetical protein
LAHAVLDRLFSMPGWYILFQPKLTEFCFIRPKNNKETHMRVTRFLAIVLMAVVMAGCSSLSVQSDFDPSVNFAQLKTYAWQPAPPPTGDPRIDGNTLLQERIQAAVDKTLVAKGYIKASNGKPDFLVGYFVNLQSKTSVSTVNTYYGYGAGWGYGGYGYGYGGVPSTQVYQYDQGTLILDISNPVGKKLMWRGAATDVVDATQPADVREYQLNQAVTKMLQNFPPKPKK